MMIKKLFLTTCILLAISAQMGCTAENSGKSVPPSDVSKQEAKKEPAAGQEEKKRNVMEGFKLLVQKNEKAGKVIESINNNIPAVSKEDASSMVIQLEEVQKKELPKLEQKFYEGDVIQKKLSKEYIPDFDINKIEGIKDSELKQLLTEARDGGFKIETAEGTFFPVINYAAYKRYGTYVTEDIRDYIDLMAIESDRVPAKDAGLVIGWDEVLKRAFSQEKFINVHKDSVKLNDIKQLYKKYLTFILYGTNNTPLFSYDSKQMVPEARTAYSGAVKNSEKTALQKTLGDFMNLLEKEHYQLTDRVEKFRKDAAGNNAF